MRAVAAYPERGGDITGYCTLQVHERIGNPDKLGNGQDTWEILRKSNEETFVWYIYNNVYDTWCLCTDRQRFRL